MRGEQRLEREKSTTREFDRLFHTPLGEQASRQSLAELSERSGQILTSMDTMDMTDAE